MGVYQQGCSEIMLRKCPQSDSQAVQRQGHQTHQRNHACFLPILQQIAGHAAGSMPPNYSAPAIRFWNIMCALIMAE